MKIIKKLIRQPLSLMGLLIILFWLTIAVFAPLIAPPGENQDPYMMIRHSYSTVPTAPSEGIPFGTTEGGYDIFYGIVWGSRTALVVGLTVVTLASLLGVLIGGIGAYAGGTVDYFTMRVVDLFMSIPFLIAVIVMTVVLGKGLDKIILALVVFSWPDYARVIRSEVLLVKKQEYVLASRLMGASHLRVFLTHTLPNSIHPMIVLVSVNFGKIILIVAAMSFIGIGTEPGYADWGQILNFARNWISGIPGEPFKYWYTYVYPSLAIFSFVLGWTFLGDSIRDIMDG